MKSVTGTYLIDAMLRETLIGEVTLRIGEYSSQSSTTPSSIPTNSQNQFMEKSIPPQEPFETGIKDEPFETGIENEQFKTGIDEVGGETVVATQESEEGGGCLIATATYGSELAPQVQQLRELRDNQLLQTESGTVFMSTFNDIYYSFSPIIADYERENPYFKEAVKLAITPMISTLSLMENAESESEVLSIGISVIVLNLGMYLGVPAIVIVGIRKIK